MIGRIWAIAQITYKEGLRNRALHGIGIIAVLMLVMTQVICSMIPRSVGKVAIDLSLSTLSLSGLLIVLFVGINLMAKDLDRKTIYMVLSRPVTRSEYIIGKYIGMVLLVLVTMAILGALSFVSLLLVKSTYPAYAERFTAGNILLAMVAIALMYSLLAALSFLFSSLTSTSFVTLVLTLCTYLIGQVTADVVALIETSGKVGIDPSPLVRGLVKGAYYLFPNFSLFDLKMQAAHGLSVSSGYVLTVFSYWLVYTFLALVGAILLFSRREFP